MEQKIKLNKDNILRLEIETSDGKSTNEFLEFDLEDVELPLKLQDMFEKDRKNKEWIKNKLVIIDKKEDIKTSKLLSKKEEERIKAIKSFFDKEIEIYNMLLGENGVQKLLNGRKFGWTTLEEIDTIISEQIAPYLSTNAETISNKIKRVYSQKSKANNNTLK